MSECRVIGTFKFTDGTKCKLLAFHKPDEGMVNGREKMLPRGQTDKASMDKVALRKFWKNHNDVPLKWQNKIFVFPETPDSHECVCCVGMDIDRWRRGRIRLDCNFGRECVLVHFS